MTWTHAALVAALIAAIINMAAAFYQPDGQKARVRFYVGLYAVFYVGAYAAFLWGSIADRTVWSEALTPASVLVFLTVWNADAVIDFLRHRTQARLLRGRVEREEQREEQREERRKDQ